MQALQGPLRSFGRIKGRLGDEWGRRLAAIARDPKAQPPPRIRALGLLAQLGPEPDVELLAALATSTRGCVRSSRCLWAPACPR